MARNINIFGVKFAYPKGLRKSPGVNSHASCMRAKLKGSSGDIKSKFAAASRECRGQ